MDCSLLGTSVHGISQARIVEWTAISSPRDRPRPGMDASSELAGGFGTDEPPGKAHLCVLRT